jgi:hypothetical protein
MLSFSARLFKLGTAFLLTIVPMFLCASWYIYLQNNKKEWVEISHTYSLHFSFLLDKLIWQILYNMLNNA